MPDEVKFLVVGLGNPGEQYEFTPHNLGFLAIDRLAERHSIRVTRKECDARVGSGVIHGKAVALVKPQTFMNDSGRAVNGLLGRYEVGLDRLAGLDRLIVVYDELDLPWGTLRIKPRGSAAGHNGMKSVIAHVGTQNFPRVRVGVDCGRGRGPEYLLSPLKRQQKMELEEMAIRAAEAVESILAEGVEKSMAMYNRRAQGLEQEEE